MDIEINARIATLLSTLRERTDLCETNELESLLEELTQLVGQTNVVPARSPVVCNRCKRTDAPMYMLRRSGGKYIAICRDVDGGCWKQETPHVCDWVDHMGVQCTMTAEWRVGYGDDGRQSINSCIFHVPVFLTDIEKHVITRLD